MRPFSKVVFGALVLASCRDNLTPPAPTGAASAGPEPAASTARADTLERVRLRAQNEAGVPLHPEARAAAVSGRVPDGTLVQVLGRSDNWLEILAPDGARGWITQRYVEGKVDAGAPVAPRPTSAGAATAGSPWQSRADCEKALASGQRLERAAGVARLGTWNVRWFPDGKPGKGQDGQGTDLAWLGCSIAWMNVDALAVQEFKANERARRSVAELLQILNRHTSGRWEAKFDDCPNSDSQHVGLLVNRARVTVKAETTVAELNPHGTACKDNLRPGFSAYLTLPGGLDFHFVSVHTKSGTERRSSDLRERSLKALSAADRVLLGIEPDADVIIAGDFNTMGCKDCSPSIGADDELTRMDTTLAGLAPPFRRLTASKPCSEYHAGHGTLLDHFLVSRSFSEVGQGITAQVSGICHAHACAVRPPDGPGAAQRELSDHCPLLLDIPDRDLD